MKVIIIERLCKKFQTGEIFQRLSISERSVSYKSRVLNDVFTDLINLTLSGLAIDKIKDIDFF